jgi:hypothetical protein
MSKKIDRAKHGPSWIEVILGAVLSLALGVVIGAVLLVLRPVKVVRELPKDDARDPEMIYFVEGSRDGTKGREAAVKRKAFVEGKSVSVNEDELNALAGPATAFASAPVPPGGKPPPEKPADPAAEMIATGTPNFRIRDSVFQVGVPVTVSVSFLGFSEKVVVQARGGFAKEGDQFAFQPAEFYFGSLPLQRLPVAVKYARERFLNTPSIPEELKASWAKLANVEVEGNVLKLTMP